MGWFDGITNSMDSMYAQSLQLCPTPCNPMDCSMSGSSVFPGQESWSGLPFPSPGDLPNSGIKPRSPALQADSLPAKPQGKPKNTGVGSLSLLQRIFPTQKSNQGLLHCRQNLYQLNYQGRPPLSRKVKVLVPHSCLTL